VSVSYDTNYDNSIRLKPVGANQVALDPSLARYGGPSSAVGAKRITK